jgi:hypothetical protein
MTVPQHMLALRAANRRRSEARDFRRRLSRMPRRQALERLSFEVMAPDETLAGSRLDLALGSLRSVGPVKTARILRRAGVLPRTSLRCLSPEQRESVVRELLDMADACSGRGSDV